MVQRFSNREENLLPFAVRINTLVDSLLAVELEQQQANSAASADSSSDLD